MARYIDADDLLKALKEERKNGNFVFTSKWIKEIMDNLPIADVVPKSEVERLEKDNEKLTVNMNAFGLAAKRLKEEKDALIKNYAECMKDYVREIFEEISKASVEWGCYCITTSKSGFLTDDVNRTLAELKKKYTESEDKE